MIISGRANILRTTLFCAQLQGNGTEDSGDCSDFLNIRSIKKDKKILKINFILVLEKPINNLNSEHSR